MDDEPRLARSMARLRSFARLVRFDRRGIGMSDPIAPTDPPTLEQWGGVSDSWITVTTTSRAFEEVGTCSPFKTEATAWCRTDRRSRARAAASGVACCCTPELPDRSRCRSAGSNRLSETVALTRVI